MISRVAISAFQVNGTVNFIVRILLRIIVDQSSIESFTNARKHPMKLLLVLTYRLSESLSEDCKIMWS